MYMHMLLLTCSLRAQAQFSVSSYERRHGAGCGKSLHAALPWQGTGQGFWQGATFDTSCAHTSWRTRCKIILSTRLHRNMEVLRAAEKKLVSHCPPPLDCTGSAAAHGEDSTEHGGSAAALISPTPWRGRPD